MEKSQNFYVEEIELGQPIPWDLVNSDGTVLFKKGFIFNSRKSIDRVKSLNLYHRATAPISTRSATNCETISTKEAIRSTSVHPGIRHNNHSETKRANADTDSPAKIDDSDANEVYKHTHFEDISGIMLQLKDWNDDVVSGAKIDKNIVPKLAENILDLYRQSSHQALASIQLLSKYPQVYRHPISSAMLCLMCASMLDLGSDDHILSFMCAALTANISLYNKFEKLNNSTASLSPEQKLEVFHHPIKSARILKGLGIKDEIWLNIVEQHHEDHGGSGYPKGIKSSKFFHEISIYNLADTYLSITGNRGYREQVNPAEGLIKLREIIDGHDLKSKVFPAFKQGLGEYPPGSLVRLSDYRLALVYQYNKGDSVHPVVIPLLDSAQRPVAEYSMLDLTQESVSIVGGELSKAAIGLDLAEIYSLHNE